LKYDDGRLVAARMNFSNNFFNGDTLNITQGAKVVSIKGARCKKAIAIWSPSHGMASTVA